MFNEQNIDLFLQEVT